ncbi:MAG: hypothetical protein U1F53_10535 [Burkholderiaceae bacterium]
MRSSSTTNSSPPRRPAGVAECAGVGQPAQLGNQGHVVAGPQGLLHALGDLSQQLVAGVVAEAVVDQLEAVEVHEQHGECVAGFLVRPCHAARQRALDARAVG